MASTAEIVTAHCACSRQGYTIHSSVTGALTVPYFEPTGYRLCRRMNSRVLQHPQRKRHGAAESTHNMKAIKFAIQQFRTAQVMRRLDQRFHIAEVAAANVAKSIRACELVEIYIENRPAS